MASASSNMNDNISNQASGAGTQPPSTTVSKTQPAPGTQQTSGTTPTAAARHGRFDIISQGYAVKSSRILDHMDDIITLIVGQGDEQIRCQIHRNVLCDSSEYFTAQCRPEWLGPNCEVGLPEDEPNIIKAMVRWMYYKDIYVESPVWDKRGLLDPAEAMATPWAFFAKLYVLADKYGMLEFAKDALDAIMLHAGDHQLNLGVMSWVYANTKDKDSPLRCLFIKIFRWKSTDTHFNSYLDLPTEFLREVVEQDLYHNEALSRPSKRPKGNGKSHEVREVIHTAPEGYFCETFHGPYHTLCGGEDTCTPKAFIHP